MTRLAGINVQANSSLIQGFHNHIAIRIKNIEQTPFIDHYAVLIYFGNNIAHGTHIFAIKPLVV